MAQRPGPRPLLGPGNHLQSFFVAQKQTLLEALLVSKDEPGGHSKRAANAGGRALDARALCLVTPTVDDWDWYDTELVKVKW